MPFLPGSKHHAYRHGHSLQKARSGAYKSWLAMIDRCNPANIETRPLYAGAGITVCERWHEFQNFLADMGDRPTGCSIDRIDPNGNYEPGNCRWASTKEQALNRKTTIHVEINGDRLCLSDASLKYGIPVETIRARYKKGLKGEDLISRINRNSYRKGTRASRCKLSDADVADIKSRIQSGAMNKALGLEFGVSSSVISEIRHGKSWPHVMPDGSIDYTRRTEDLPAADNKNIRLITVNGVTKSMTAWALEMGLPKGTVHARIKRGWPDDIAVTAPLGAKYKPVEAAQ
ncbi:hypothetical protein VPH49_24360 [Pseudomonas luteola]|uniref:hypothetical protein n=1 Tax=Pseudomonas luteola TaxID=47886 RepID=UPI003A8BDDD6